MVRKGFLCSIAVLFVGLNLCSGQVVTAVTDAASYARRVAPGALATIFGTNIAGSTAQASSTPLPQSLGSATVTIGGVIAPLLYVSPNQIDFQVPSSLAAGQANLTVTAPRGTSNSFSVTVLSQAPAIFQYGTNHAVAQNSDASSSLNGSSKPAAAGSVLTVYLTGQGAVNNPVPDGTLTPSSPLATATATAAATIGGQNAPVQFLGLSPGFVGLAQANIQVPALPTGDYPLVITEGGTVSVSAIVSVSGTGSFTNPLALVASAGFTNSPPSSVALLGNLLYVCGRNNIQIVDVTNPLQPAYVGEFGDSALAGYGGVCAINTTPSSFLADVVSPPGQNISFAVFNLTNPTSPALLSNNTTSYSDVLNLSFNLTYGFATTNYITYSLSDFSVVAQNGDFLAFDFSTPSAPTFIGIVQNTGQTGSSDLNLKPYAAVLNSTTAYIATTTATATSTTGQGALTIVDIASPSTPTPVNEVLIPNSNLVLTFAAAGNTLLAASNTAGQRNPGNPNFDFLGNLSLATLDITNIDTPVVLASFDSGLQVNGTRNSAPFSNGVFAIVNNPPITDDTGPASLMVVDARNPSSPVLYPVQTEFGLSGILATTTGFLFAPTVHGLNVYQLQLQ